MKSDEIVFSVWVVLRNKIPPKLAKQLGKQIEAAIKQMPIVERVSVERQDHQDAAKG